MSAKLALPGVLVVMLVGLPPAPVLGQVGRLDPVDEAADVKQRWVKVQVRNGEGYVPEEQIRSPVEHAACFVKTESGWRMTGLAPGGG